jgi:MFS family permease
VSGGPGRRRIRLFVLLSGALILLERHPTPMLLYVMVGAQGALGYGLTSIMGAVVVEIYQGKHYGSILGMLLLAGIAGGALGPWVTGVLYDDQASYAQAFWIGAGLSCLSAVAIWLAAPRKVRAVAGRMHRLQQPAAQG